MVRVRKEDLSEFIESRVLKGGNLGDSSQDDDGVIH
jgi:hypothetical protein